MGAAVFEGIIEGAGEGMRELKFRAWHKDAHWMRPVADISFQDRLVSVRMEEDSPTRGPYLTVPLDAVELMQWTGLIDGNDVEIYEGDILRMADATAKVVFWEKPPEFGLDFSHNEDKWCEDWNLSDDSERMEVIGNIYEYPELLSTMEEGQ